MILLLPVSVIFAQKKPVKKEKPPTQKEMPEEMKKARGMMKEMMEEMSDEDKKMMESLGVKITDIDKAVKKMPTVSDKQLAEAWEDESRIVPKKDAARIAAIPKPVNDAGLATYIAAVHVKSTLQISKENNANAEKIYNYIQSSHYNSQQAGNIAMGLWLYGKPEVALCMMGKICMSDISNMDNLSNYAAMLTMQGGQHVAIPLLENLNKKFKWNSTLLNNLGQAWFGLGDLNRATLYLDSAITLYPYHPQATLTKAAIEESKGNTATAIANVKKSIKHAYTPEKEGKLKGLGYKLKRSDLYVPFVRSGDPLELGKIHRPDYPTSVEEAIRLYPQWNEFISECKMRIEKLSAELPDATAGMINHVQSTANGMMKNFQAGILPTKIVPQFAVKASLDAKRVVEYFEERQRTTLIPNGIKMSHGLQDIRQAHKNPSADAPCSAHQASKSELIKKLNTFRKRYDDEFLEEYRHFLSDMGYFALFTSTDENMLKIISIQYQIAWLEKNVDLKPEFEGVKETSTLCDKEVESSSYGKLQDFDYTDACNYKKEISMGGPITMKINCTHTTWEFKSKFLDYTRVLGANDVYERSSVVIKPEIKGSAPIGPLKAGAAFGAEVTVNMDPKGVKDWNAVIKAEAELGVGHSVGPVSAEAKVSTAIEMEVDQNGFKDFIFIDKAEVNVGIKVPGLEGKGSTTETINKGIGKVNEQIGKLDGSSVSAGVENRVSLISGSSRTGTGILSGIKFQ